MGVLRVLYVRYTYKPFWCGPQRPVHVNHKDLPVLTTNTKKGREQCDPGKKYDFSHVKAIYDFCHVKVMYDFCHVKVAYSFFFSTFIL